MRKILFTIIAGLTLTVFSCREKKADDAAARAAKEYYDSLFAGNYAFFVRGMYLSDTIPASYREQLEVNARMFIDRMNREHHGVNEVRIMNFVNDTTFTANTNAGRKSATNTADSNNQPVYTSDVFLVLSLKDSLNEEIIAPMIYHKDRWLMR